MTEGRGMRGQSIIRLGTRPPARVILAVALSVISCAAALATTSVLDGKTPTGLAPGSPAGSYSLSGFETVNLYNGGLNFALPLLTLGGRGSAGYTVILPFEQKWIAKAGKPNILGGAGQLFTPSPNWWQGVDSGLRTPYGPGMLQARRGVYVEDEAYYDVDCHFELLCLDTDCGLGPQEVAICSNLSLLHVRTLTRLTFTAPDGTEYELRDRKTNGEPQEAVWRVETGMVEGFSRGTVFASADGSSVTFISDSPVNDYVAPDLPLPLRLTSPSGYLLLPNGTRYRIDSGKVSWIRDRNGNVVSFDYGANNRVAAVTDSVGRGVTFSYANFNDADPNNDYDEITFKGSGGAGRKIRVLYDTLEHRLRPNSGYAVGSLYGLFGFSPSQTSTYNPRRVAEVELPDGRRYKLYYNPYGELARVELPTGGATEYDWAMRADNSVGYIFRYVTKRRLYAEGGTTPESVTEYVRSGDGATSTVEVKTTDSSGAALLSQSTHYFYGDAPESMEEDPARPGAVSYSKWKEGREYSTKLYDIVDNAPVLKQVVGFTWRQPTPAATWPIVVGQGETDEAAAKPNNPQVTEKVTTLSDTDSASKQVFSYDRYVNRTDVWEYDYGAGQPGALLRHTKTAYATTLAGRDYACDPAAACADGAAAGGAIHLRDLVASQSVYDPAGIERSRTTFEYDNYTPDAGGGNRHWGLQAYGDIFGLCLKLDADGNCVTPSDAAYTTRGNVTGVTSYLLDKDGNVTGSVTANSRYDIAGNVVKSIDALGHETSLDFSDRFGSPDSEARGNTSPSELVNAGNKFSYAFATKATNALGHAAYTQFDYYVGQVVNVEDANGTVSNTHYDDPLDRPTKAERAVNVPALHAQASVSYDDVNRAVTTTSDLNSLDDNLLKGEIIYDGLGRTTEARRYETATQYVSMLTKYDALGRASEVSNPYRPTLGESAVWTKTSYDALGRAWMVTTPDGAKVITHFDGPRTLVTDQAGKRRLSKVDALGRLAEVWEVRSADAATGTEAVSFPHYADVPDVAAGYRTAYKYDALGNLRKVEQGAQSRFFAYDSLGRLLRAKNPEQDANAALALPANTLNSPADSNNSWSLKYEYDEAGNLKKRTDARGVETSYAYDALGRVTDRSYTDVHPPHGGAVSTPPVKYIYDAQPLPDGAPAFDRGKSLGHLAAVTYGGATSTTGSYLGGYDDLGRAHYSSQVTALPDATGQLVPQSPYVLGYEYNLDGSLKSETYPSGRVVVSEYDAAGRLAGVKRQGGDYYAGGDPSVTNNPNVIAYAAHGGVSSVRLGNGLWEHTLYIERLQPYEIGLGTSRMDSSKLKLEYGYGLPAGGTVDPAKNNGNVQSQKISVPAEGSTPARTFAQSYTYDALNRLEAASEANGVSETWRQTYSYDRFGNRRLDELHTTKLNSSGATVYAVDSSNRATLNPAVSPSTNRITEAGYTFDASGDLLCDPIHPCGPTLNPYFDYDAEGRMMRAAGGAQAGGSEYAYDGDGRRVKKVTGGLTTVFVYDAGGALVAEYGGAQSQAGGVSYLTQDALGSTRAVTGQNGEVKSRHDYLPFGEEIDGLKAPNSGRASFASYNYGTVRQKFTGYERDDETGLEYAQARYFSSVQARFTSVDPLPASAKPTNPQTWNRYAYVSNNPLASTDPTGMIEWRMNDTTRAVDWYNEGDDRTGTTEIQPDEHGVLRYPYVGDSHYDVILNPKGPIGFWTALYAADNRNLGLGYGMPPHWGTVREEAQGWKLALTPEAWAAYSASGAVEMKPDHILAVCGLIEGGFTLASGLRASTSAEGAVGSGLSMDGLAYETRFVDKHLPGTVKSWNLATGGKDAAHVFNDLSTLSRVESEIFARGVNTGTVRGAQRFGLYFDGPIGFRVANGRVTNALCYGEMKVDGPLYHVIPRTGPSTGP
jgi:RHS repeat-associated protein